MLEYDYVFDTADDPYKKLEEEHKKLQEKHDRLVIRYISVIDALISRLKSDKERKIYLIDKYQRENNEITTEIEGFKNTKQRDLEEGK